MTAQLFPSSILHLGMIFKVPKQSILAVVNSPAIFALVLCNIISVFLIEGPETAWPVAAALCGKESDGTRKNKWTISGCWMSNFVAHATYGSTTHAHIHLSQFLKTHGCGPLRQKLRSLTTRIGVYKASLYKRKYLQDLQIIGSLWRWV